MAVQLRAITTILPRLADGSRRARPSLY